METARLTAVAILSGIGVSLAVALALLAWGRRLPRQGDWLAGLALLASFLVPLWVWLGHEAWAFDTRATFWGWIWPRAERGALNVGLLEDPVSLSLAMLTALLGAVFVGSRGLVSREERPERLYAAALFGA